MSSWLYFQLNIFYQLLYFPLPPITGLYSCNVHFDQGDNCRRKCQPVSFLQAAKWLVWTARSLHIKGRKDTWVPGLVSPCLKKKKKNLLVLEEIRDSREFCRFIMLELRMRLNHVELPTSPLADLQEWQRHIHSDASTRRSC